MDGKVKWFSRDKGFGFIIAVGGGEHYFNVKDIRGIDLPDIGDVVTFESGENGKGLRALGVTIVSKSMIWKANIEEHKRAECLNCGMQMVPRLIYGRSMLGYRIEPEKSICPYCSFVYRDFGNWSFISTNVYCYIVSGYLNSSSLVKGLIKIFLMVSLIYVWMCFFLKSN